MKKIRRKSNPKRSSKTPAGRPESRRAELLSLAKTFGIKNRHRMTRPQLIQAIESHQKKSRISKPTFLRAKPVRPPAGRAGTVPTPTAIRPKRTYDDLPWSYGETELVLMPVDPFLIYAYWDFSPEDWETIQRRRRPVVLRVYDVTMIEFNGGNAHHYFDLPVTLETQNWYVRLWSAEKSLCADLGWTLPDGSFQTLVRSNVIQTPRAGVSIFEEVRWVEIRPGRRRADTQERIKKRREEHELRRVIRPHDRSQKKQLAFWKQLEEQADGLTAGEIAGLSSMRMRTMTPPKRQA